MAEYGQTVALVKRERETEQRVRSMDAIDIVEEIHKLEDRVCDLEEEIERWRDSITEAMGEIEVGAPYTAQAILRNLLQSQYPDE